jgi:hypothetical protein
VLKQTWLDLRLAANQIWSIAGESDRASVSSMFVQPFLTYTTHTFTTDRHQSPNHLRLENGAMDRAVT